MREINNERREVDIKELALILSKKIDKEIFNRKYAPAKEILILVGAGVFIVGSLLVPGLPKVLKPYLDEKRKNEYEAWKRFNLPYLKRTLERLEKQKVIEIDEANGYQIIKVTEKGKEKIIKFSMEDLVVTKPKVWNRRWRLISFDLPQDHAKKRKIFLEYLKNWGFYPVHRSVYLHAYPCFKELNLLTNYLGIRRFIRFFYVSDIENPELFKNFFNI